MEGERERPNPDYNRQLNKVLANGGRLYVDGAHPEYSTPECTNPREVVAYERISERILGQCLDNMARLRGRDQFVLYRTIRTARETVTGIMKTICSHGRCLLNGS